MHRIWDWRKHKKLNTNCIVWGFFKLLLYSLFSIHNKMQVHNWRGVEGEFGYSSNEVNHKYILFLKKKTVTAEPYCTTASQKTQPFSGGSTLNCAPGKIPSRRPPNRILVLAYSADRRGTITWGFLKCCHSSHTGFIKRLFICWDWISFIIYYHISRFFYFRFRHFINHIAKDQLLILISI